MVIIQRKKYHGKWCELDNNGNALMAAILCANKTTDGETLSLGYTGDSQQALYEYWNTWVDAVDEALEEKGYKSGASGLSKGTAVSSGLLDEYRELARTNSYCVTIMYLTSMSGNHQRIIFVQREDPEPLKRDIPVEKVWIDGENAYNTRPSEITVNLLADGEVVDELTLNESNNWKGTFEDLSPTDESGNTIQYTVEEAGEPEGYRLYDIDGDASSGFEIRNRLLTDITVKKQWDDNNNGDNIRPSSIEVKLYRNGNDAGRANKTLNADNNWEATFTNLYKYDLYGNEFEYTVEEIDVTGYVDTYESEKDDNGNTTITITNKAIKEINVEKKWEDNENARGLRPESIKARLYANGTYIKTKILKEENNWKAKFEELDRFDENGEIKYTVKESPIDNYIDEYETIVDENGNTTVVITNFLDYEGYIEITGRVWEDNKDGKSTTVNGIFDNNSETEQELGGIKVTLKDADGDYFNSNNKTDWETSTVKTDENGQYVIKVNVDTTRDVYKLCLNPNGEEGKYESLKERLDGAYVEFEYDGLTYTTVKPMVDATSSQQSKAIEDEDKRESLDSTYSTIDSSTLPKSELTDEAKNITAITQNVITSFDAYQAIEENKETRNEDVTVRYCDGTNYQETNTQGAWLDITTGHTHGNCPLSDEYEVEVITIKNVNLGLMRREQPNLEIEEELSTVQVNINGQSYTYEYAGVKELETNEDSVKVQFQGDIGEGNGLYVYRRPVNPSNIAELNNGKGEMSVYVTYKVEVTNTADTLTSKVNSIINYFDKEYTLESATIDGNNITNSISNESNFNKATLNGLGIELAPQTTSSVIELRYKVSENAIKGLLGDEATLSNAVEIESYSTYYGEGTLYAEQRTGERTGNPYGGYDKNSHPGNAGIHLEEVDFTYKYYDTTTTYEDEKVLVATVPEDDTDIAPSFLLCKDETPKTLSGTVFEDTDVITDDSERLGDGKYDSSTEKNIQNMKVELYEVKSDGTPPALATLYDTSGNVIENGAVKHTDANGNYAFDGIVTGKEYYVKFTYGDDTSELAGATKIKDVEPAVNARNYKSTVIADETLKGIMQSNSTDFDKYWYIKIGDNNSIAVDNMKDRLEIEDLQYSNFYTPENMSAYSKSFIIPVEFDTNTGAAVNNNTGSIEGISNNLSKIDFGIIERPREDLFTEKTITNIKITLANGQKLIQGDPRTDKLNYVKTMGFQDIENSQQARAMGNKRLLAELDAELTQGAQLEISYEVNITNHNELDYDYEANYDDIVLSNETGNYITAKTDAYYYYYGDKTYVNDEKILKTTLQVVDYMSSNISYEENEGWEKVDVETLHQAQLISDDAYNVIKEECIVLQPKESSGSITLARGETSNTLNMTVRKMLTSQEKNVYENHAEIIKIDAKTARTIQVIGGEVVEKTYKPGNYAPGLGIDEQDDDGAEVIITPPTGINYIIIYIIAGLIGLIVIAVGTIFIKKKVLTK